MRKRKCKQALFNDSLIFKYIYIITWVVFSYFCPIICAEEPFKRQVLKKWYNHKPGQRGLFAENVSMKSILQDSDLLLRSSRWFNIKWICGSSGNMRWREVSELLSITLLLEENFCPRLTFVFNLTVREHTGCPRCWFMLQIRYKY